MQCDHLFIAGEQIRHTALGDPDSALGSFLVNLWDTSMLNVPQVSDQGNDIETKLAVRKRPSSFLFWTAGLVKLWALCVVTAANRQG
jgi:hypothetical protein